MRIAGIDFDNVIQFYKSAAWKHLRARVLKMDRNECQMCRAQGNYSKAVTVHHVHHVRDRPDLALSLYDENGERNLVSLCKQCHNKVHPEKFRTYTYKQPLTPERWD